MKKFFNFLAVIGLLLLAPSCGVEAYNPKKLPEFRDFVDVAIKQVVQEIEAEGWSPANPADKGSYGKEVHRRVAELLNVDNKAFLGEMWVRQTAIDTFEIVSIGTEPVNKTGLINIDVARMQTKSAGWASADVFTSSQMFGAFEIKTSASGTWTPGQEARYLTVVGGEAERVFLSLPPKIWSFKLAKMIPHAKYLEWGMIFKRGSAKLFVAGGVAGASVLTIAGLTQIDKFHQEYKKYAAKVINKSFPSDEEKMFDCIQVQSLAIEVIGSMAVNGGADLLKGFLPYFVLDQFAFANQESLKE